MASGTTVVIPSDGANTIQMAPGLPSVALQTSGATPYLQYGAQQIPTSVPQQVQQKGLLETFFNAEPKVLGAVQILIGLIHIGFGVVSLFSNSIYARLPIASVGGYPFWGGIFFICSGSLCVAAVNSPNHSLVRSSVGMNITSAIMSLIGMFLNITDLIANDVYVRYSSEHDHLSSLCCAISSMLLLFSALEFCITVSLAHFGCQAACCNDDQHTVLFMPYQLIGGRAVAAEPNPPPAPPTYNNMDTKPE